jgi:hypothetical protein
LDKPELSSKNKNSHSLLLSDTVFMPTVNHTATASTIYNKVDVSCMQQLHHKHHSLGYSSTNSYSDIATNTTATNLTATTITTEMRI